MPAMHALPMMCCDSKPTYIFSPLHDEEGCRAAPRWWKCDSSVNTHSLSPFCAILPALITDFSALKGTGSIHHAGIFIDDNVRFQHPRYSEP
jgi:hypothetical protein